MERKDKSSRERGAQVSHAAALYCSVFVSQKCSSWKLKDQPLESERKRVSSHKSLQPVKRNSVKYGQATATRNYGILVFPSNLTEGNIDCSELNFEFPFIAYITSHHIISQELNSNDGQAGVFTFSVLILQQNLRKGF